MKKLILILFFLSGSIYILPRDVNVNRSITLSPAIDTNIICDDHIFTAQTDPLAFVEFFCIAGPSLGYYDFVYAGPTGEAQISYSSCTPGTDYFIATYVDDFGQTHFSDTAIKVWEDSSCMSIINDTTYCDSLGIYIYEFQVQNKSYVKFIEQLEIAVDSPQGTNFVVTVPSTINIPGLLPPRNVSQVFRVKLIGPGAVAYTEVCYTLSAIFEHDDCPWCCYIENCIKLPICECAEVIQDSIYCVDGEYFYNFTLQNGTQYDVTKIQLTSPGTDPITFIPQTFHFSPPILPGQLFPNLTAEILGAAAGMTIPIRIKLFDSTSECCYFEVLYTIPPCHTVSPCDNKGTDFWLMFNGNVDHSEYTLYITSEVTTSGTVDIPGLGFTFPFSVAANDVTPVVLPASTGIHTSGVIDNKGIHVTSLDEVAIYGFSYHQFTSGGFLALPTDVLGTDYIVLTYSNTVNNGVKFGIVATQNSTIVTLTPSGGVPYNITMNQGDTYELSDDAASADFTGTTITSTNPVGVMGAARCAFIPFNIGACDYVCEMLPPTNDWGNHFFTVPLSTRLNGDTWRILASQDGTNVFINGSPQTVINKGEYIETILTVESEITSDKPILVSQYSNGNGYDGITDADPFMMLISPVDGFLTDYVVSCPASGYAGNYINIVSPNSVVSTLTVDAVTYPTLFNPIGSSGYSVAKIPVQPGKHTLNASLPFGCTVYGFNLYNAYGYPGGMGFCNNLIPPPRVSIKLSGQGMNNFRNSALIIPDTIRVSLRNSTSPFELVASGIGFTDSLGKVSPQFLGSVPSGNYYIVVNHRNSIETWSTSPQTMAGDSMTYDFTNSSSKAYGNNMIQVGNKWCIYSGDINQDGAVDLTDIVNIYNDATDFKSGGMVTDITGDGFVDLNDLTMAFNNANSFVRMVRP